MRPESHPAFDGHERVVFANDPASGLAAIIAVHSTALGPASGGCRFASYTSEADALGDALRLSRGMSYKNAMAELPAGGGKAVIFRAGPDREAVFEAFGREVDTLAGAYLTAEDVGTTIRDMEIIARKTHHVSGLSVKGEQAGGDPSPWTALGVFLSIQAAMAAPLRGCRVAVQGVGAVGFHLCRMLREVGADLVVADVNPARLEAVSERFGAQIASIEEIHRVDADVFAPCALGAGLNAVTIPELRAGLVCGAANNQLATDADGEALHQRGVVYCPDYVVNAGGIINVMAEHFGEGGEVVEQRVRKIPARLADILQAARVQNRPTDAVADERAQARLTKVTPSRVA